MQRIYCCFCVLLCRRSKGGGHTPDLSREEAQRRKRGARGSLQLRKVTSLANVTTLVLPALGEVSEMLEPGVFPLREALLRGHLGRKGTPSHAWLAAPTAGTALRVTLLSIPSFP